jgi:hypothetical protein
VNRSSLYYEPVKPDAEELELMRRLDELHLKYPFYGSRKLTQGLKAEGHDVNRKRVQRLVRVMGGREHGAEAEHEQAVAGARKISVFTAESEDLGRESGMRRGHHIYPDGVWLHLPGGEPVGPVGLFYSGTGAAVAPCKLFCFKRFRAISSARGGTSRSGHVGNPAIDPPVMRAKSSQPSENKKQR